jgi:hypothetical protein
MVKNRKFKNTASIVCLLTVLLLSECKQGNNTIMDGLIEIDVSQKYPSKTLYLQDIAKVEYIPLETNANTLMSLGLNMIAYVSDDYIIATNSTQGDIFVFDGKGKSKYSFNHKGQGPLEYTNLYGGIAFDEKALDEKRRNKGRPERTAEIIIYRG